ncbi:MAG: ribosome small subunit-dependent GTPase A [Clostridiales bacterium]|jgi:ribosome biogenesis GTPase|nr:ribosome small subunit-dependent GTPase A [Clostridiales bacterium]
MIGKVIKGIGGFYFVKSDDLVIRGQGRGILKKNKGVIKIGDQVEYELRPDGECIITKIFARNNELVRPAISNIDKLIVTVAAKSPNPNFLSVDKLCIISEYLNVPVMICVNKIDLIEKNELGNILDIYKDVYEVVLVDAKHNKGIDELLKAIEGKTVALVGPSGVGKSTILNSILPLAKAETGELSSKTDRGKHTTRHAEIFSINDNTNIFDTPGFTSLDLPDISIDEIRKLFPEFNSYSKKCRFRDCMHINEPECSVKSAVEKGLIGDSRYKAYLSFINEARDNSKY